MPVSIEKSESVWTVIHDRPDARNAVDTEHAEALVEAFLSFEASSAKAAVFWGKGGNFCAGWGSETCRIAGRSRATRSIFRQTQLPHRVGPFNAGAHGAFAAGAFEARHWRD